MLPAEMLDLLRQWRKARRGYDATTPSQPRMTTRLAVL